MAFVSSVNGQPSSLLPCNKTSKERKVTQLYLWWKKKNTIILCSRHLGWEKRNTGNKKKPPRATLVIQISLYWQNDAMCQWIVQQIVMCCLMWLCAKCFDYNKKVEVIWAAPINRNFPVYNVVEIIITQCMALWLVCFVIRTMILNGMRMKRRKNKISFYNNGLMDEDVKGKLLLLLLLLDLTAFQLPWLFASVNYC